MTDFQQPAISGSLQVAEFNLKELLQQLGQAPLETSDATALSRVSLSTTLAGSANRLTLNPLQLQLDDTAFSGSASLDLQTLAQSITLKGGRLDADRYLPPATTSDTDSAPAAAGQSSGTDSSAPWSKEEIIPLAPLQALDLDAVLDLEQLQIAGLVLDQPVSRSTPTGVWCN